MIIRKSAQEIETMARAGKVVAETIALLEEQVQPGITTGELVPDELTVALIEERLGQPDAVEGFVLDGFPRNLAQAEALDRMLGRVGRDLDAILFFDVPDEVGLGRALRRAELENRPDDTSEVIRRRLDIYHAETEPIVEHYRATGKLVPLHAGGTIEQVWAEIQSALAQLEEDAA